MGLHVAPFNSARRLYERQGFREVELRGLYLYMVSAPPQAGCRGSLIENQLVRHVIRACTYRHPKKFERLAVGQHANPHALSSIISGWYQQVHIERLIATQRM